MRQRAIVFLVLMSMLSVRAVAGDFVPDPATVQRDGPGYRYPQAGWIVLHVEGTPYERGEQQGTLLWREIQNYIKCFAMQKSSTAPEEAWRVMRTMTDALFVRRFDPELLEEMKGIADGAAAAGAKFDGKPLDLTDIVAINVWPEYMTLDPALDALPNGLEGKDFSSQSGGGSVGGGAAQVSRCSAFAATGPATRDGKAIIGHITMYDLYPCDFFNVWIDVKPASGHRVIFQGAPGSVQSGMDWYMNDAGMVLTETTIRQTRFDPTGLSIGSRSRRAMQYGDSVDSVTGILGEGGNGLYTNEWLLADMKSNEIALFELGTKTSYLLRSSKNQWFGGTTGFYWGNNNTKDLSVRLETIAATNDRPEDMTFCPEARDMRWIHLYQANKGTIDADFARRAFGQPPLATGASCDCKFTTSDMAMQLKSVAHWGDPYGQLWEGAPDEQAKFPDEKPLVPGDWTVMTPNAPAPLPPGPQAAAVDLKNSSDEGGGSGASPSEPPEPPPAWHGTILPATDGDVWLASGFARYHDFVAREKQIFTQHEQEAAGDSEEPKEKDKSDRPDKSSVDLTQDEKDELAVDLFHFRADARSIGMAAAATPLRQIKFDPADDVWHISASGRGSMLLSELRRRMGTDKFIAAMDAFGRAHAGAAVGSDAFVAAMNAAGGADLSAFFTRWLDGTDALPTLELAEVSMVQKDSDYVVAGRVMSHGGCTPASIDVTVETGDDETTQTFPFNSGVAAFDISSDKKPTRVVVNKYGQTPCTNGWDWSASAFRRDLKHTLIIYGTDVDEVGNHIAAEKLRDGMIQQWEHEVLPIMPDTLASDDELRGHHLLLIGRPACSALFARLAGGLPVKFGPDSFVVRGQLYANADSAVIAAGSNPMDGRYSVVCIAGLSPGATLSAARALPGGADGPVRLMAANSDPKDIVPPAEELGHGF
jgi:Phospholipase B